MSRPVHDSNDLGGRTVDPVERQIVARNQHPGVRRDVRPRGSQFQMVGQALASGDDPVDEAIRGGGIVRRHMQPDLIQVGAGARCQADLRHASAAVDLARRQSLAPPALDVVGVQRTALAAFGAV